MGVYIDMEMPESCEDCPMAFSVNFGILCTPTHNIIGDSEISKRQGFCPLVPIPPHGDLIDRDALRAEVKNHATPSDAWVFSLIRTAPTIISAEEGET